MTADPSQAVTIGYSPVPVSELQCQSEASSYACFSGQRDLQNQQGPGIGQNPQQTVNAAVKPQQSSDANSASYVSISSTQAAIQRAIASGGGFVSGVGYVAPDGTVSPTNNPTFVPKSAGGSGNAGASKCRATGTASCNGN